MRLSVAFLVLNACDAIRILPHQAARRLAAEQDFEDHDSASSGSRRTFQVDVPTSPEEHLVTSLPLLEDGLFPTEHWAGHLPASSDGDKFLFYWLFAPDFKESNLTESDAPLLIWLNGGPGCSSMEGLFLEHGPFQFSQGATGAYEIKLRGTSWHKAPAYTLYVDQPVGTGLSFTKKRDYATTDEQINAQFYYFLQSFFTLHSDKFVTETGGIRSLNRNFFFSGESYAGHYLPSMVNFILKMNANLTSAANAEIRLPVTGVAIGNGWTDPYYQYSGAEYGYGHGFVGLGELAAYLEKEKQCQTLLDKNVYLSQICLDLIGDILLQSQGSNSSFLVNPYDVRLVDRKDGVSDYPFGWRVIETYLGGFAHRENLSQAIYGDVLEAIHATAKNATGRYRGCADPPFNALEYIDGLGVVADLVSILEHEDSVEVLFYNGMEDMVCNHIGNERFLDKMPWRYQAEWNRNSRYVWISNFAGPRSISGYVEMYKNLKLLKLLGSGHMVPLDIPEVALDMIRSFMFNHSFLTSRQDLDVAVESATGKYNCTACPVCSEKTTTTNTASKGGGLAGTGSMEESSNGGQVKLLPFSWIMTGAAIFFSAVLNY